MEKIRNVERKVKTLSGYTPYWGYSREDLEHQRWEVVCFIQPYCDGTCAHCWSSETFLGRVMPIEWYDVFWKDVDSDKVGEVKLTGGEPFLYKDIGRVVSIIRRSLGPQIPLRIFTGGRRIISSNLGRRGVDETVQKILQTGVVLENVEIHLSADEHHAGSLYRSNKGIQSCPKRRKSVLDMNEFGIPLLQTQVKNFLSACDIIVAGNRKFKGGKIKIHAETGRLNYHRQKIFHWLDDATWKSKVISSEGLIRSGLAQEIQSSTELLPNSQLSLFLLPGAEFYEKPQTNKAQVYRKLENQSIVFLDVARIGGNGSSIVGWWNVVNRVFCGGSAYDAYQLIGRAT